MKKIGRVIQTFSAPKGFKAKVRPIVAKLDMLEGHGIKNDKFAGKNEDRAVMIIGQKAYDIANNNGMDVSFGSLGENILLDFDPHTLAIGTILEVNGAELEVTQSCTICKSLCKFGDTLPELLANDRGIYCKVIKSGMIVQGDEITLKG